MEKTNRKYLAFRYGYMMARYPLIGIIALILLMAAFIPGLFMLDITNDPNDLWVNKEGILYEEQSISDKNFGAFFRAEQIIFKNRANTDKDLIKKEYLEEVLWFQEIAKRTRIQRGGKTYSIKDLCWSALPDTDCTIQTPLGFWQSNLTRLLNDPDPHNTTQCLKSIDPDNTMACMDETGLPVQIPVVFGGLTKVYNNDSLGCENYKAGDKKDPSTDPCAQYTYNAKTLGSRF